MSIPNEVASEFAKLVTSNDSKETEQTVYGTIVLQDGAKYVRFDGSEILTPVSTTTNVENNERVTVLIKEHQAIVTGNITSPAARTQEVTAVNDKFDNYSTTEEMNSKISQTADSIKTEVNKTLSGYVTGDDVDDALKDHPTVAQMNSAIEQKAESITSTVNKTLTNYSTAEQVADKIADISIGGTNLAADTRLMERWSYSSSGARPITRHVDDEGYGVLSWSSATATTWISARPSRDDRKPYALFRNKEVTVSFEFRGPNWVNNDYMLVYFWLDEELSDHARYGSISFRPPKTSEWVKMEQTVTVTDAMFVSGSGTLRDEAMLNIFPAVNTLGAFEIRKFKVELGNKATDWSPAPEDVDNTLKNYPTKTEMNSAITQKADSITSEVNKTLTNYSTIEQTNTKVTQTAESLSAEISGITIGGTNLLSDTRLMSRWTNSRPEGKPVTVSLDDEGFAVASWPVSTELSWSSMATTADMRMLYSAVRDREVTFSFDFRSDSWTEGETLTVYFALSNDGSRTRYKALNIAVPASNDWSRVSKTYKITDAFFTSGSGDITDDTRFYPVIYVRVLSGCEIRKIQLEIGNKATDWSPAPDDGAYSTSAVLDRSGIHLKTGGTFTVDSQNFDVDGQGKMTAKAGSIGGWAIAPGNLSSGSGTKHVRLSTEDATYAIWAGADAAGSAPFRVTRDGKVYLTKLYVTDENGNAQTNPVNLSGSWYRTNRAVQSMTVSGNTLTITLYDGTSVNFKKADGYGYITGLANGTTITIGGYKLNASGQGEIVDSGSITLTLDTENKKVNFSGGAGFKNFTAANGMDVTAMYNTGWNEALDHCSYQSDVYRISENQPASPLYMKVGNNYTSVGSGWVKTTRATGVYTLPAKKT